MFTLIRTGLDAKSKQRIPSQLRGFLDDREGAASLVVDLPKHYKPEDVLENTPGLEAWSLCGLHFQHSGHPLLAISIFHALYSHLIRYQEVTGDQTHKGTPLVWISDCHQALGHPVLAKRYLMLTLIEDAIRGRGKIDTRTTGVYPRGLSHRGLGHIQFNEYAANIWALYESHPDQSMYPEWILQQLDQDWMTEFPSSDESSYYVVNPQYVQMHIEKLGYGDGRAMEWLAEYLMSCIPGCRASRRARTTTKTDYDVACAIEGPTFDFRSELGRYFLCECKDWGTSADFSSIAEFGRVLQSSKCNFGVVFSTNDLTGKPRKNEGANAAAELERRNIFQSDKIVIVVVTEKELRQVAAGGSFISILRRGYEQIRLNLPSTIAKPKARKKKSTTAGRSR